MVNGVSGLNGQNVLRLVAREHKPELADVMIPDLNMVENSARGLHKKLEGATSGNVQVCFNIQVRLLVS